jgi:hypothetical protein
MFRVSLRCRSTRPFELLASVTKGPQRHPVTGQVQPQGGIRDSACSSFLTRRADSWSWTLGQCRPSMTRVAAGAFGFLIFSHAFDGPDRYGASIFFETVLNSHIATTRPLIPVRRQKALSRWPPQFGAVRHKRLPDWLRGIRDNQPPIARTGGELSLA